MRNVDFRNSSEVGTRWREVNNMAYTDDNFYDTFSEKSTSSVFDSSYDVEEDQEVADNSKNTNITIHVLNRQIYGRFTKNCRAKTEKVFRKIHPQCRMPLSSLVRTTENMHHVFMGFSLCGTYFLSFTEKGIGAEPDILYMLNTSYEYELHLWRFQPGMDLKYLTKYRIFKQLQDSSNVLDNVMFMQFPLDPHKIICYGVVSSNTSMAYMTILTLPSKSCRHCNKSTLSKPENVLSEGWCTKHGFILHYTFPLSNPSPAFDPYISLAYPDYLVVNTGHYIHILNITTSNPPQSSNVAINIKDEEKLGLNFNDAQSEVSEGVSDNFETNSVVDAILEDFNEYDLEGSECNKPFHELNISCEPLNVTVDPAGKEAKPKWIKKVVRRYSNGDFETSSLLSGQSRDDYNIPIEIPLIAQTPTDQLLDIVPDFKVDQITQMQLIVTQRTFDCEQFVQRQAQQLCTESQLQFLHCHDYDIKIIYVCPIEGHIICKANIKIGALRNATNCKPAIYCSEFIFTWNIATDAFKVLFSPTEKLCLVKDFKPISPFKLPKVNCQKVLVLDYGFMSTKTILRDYASNYEIYLGDGELPFISSNSNYLSSEEFFYFSESVSSDFEENLL